MALALAAVNATPLQPVSTRLAHDIRNSLSTIALHLETLERLSGPRGAKAASAAHALIAKAAGMCSDVVQEAASPYTPTRRTGFDIVAMTRQVVDLVTPIAPEELNIKIAAEAPCMAIGNAQEVFRILFNLAHNAVIVARRTRRMTELCFAIERTAAMVQVRIEDDGPGLPKDVKSHLFSRNAGRFAAAGNGYGLAIARELAERNGGTLELTPAKDGTAFTLVLSALAMVSVKEGPVTRLLGQAAMQR